MTIHSIVLAQQKFFQTDTTKDLAFRRDALSKLLTAIEENESAIFEALKKRSWQIRNGILYDGSWSGNQCNPTCHDQS